MTQGIETVARAFSSHHFDDAYPQLADDMAWTLVGEREVVGKPAVIETCQQSADYLTNVRTEFRLFKVLVGEDWVVIDSLADYTDPDGAVSTVASCDIYEFHVRLVSRITSYTVALDARAETAAG